MSKEFKKRSKVYAKWIVTILLIITIPLLFIPPYNFYILCMWGGIGLVRMIKENNKIK